MRFLRFVLFAFFWMAIGLGIGLLPLNGTTLWEKLCLAFQTSSKTAFADKNTRRPLGSYTTEEKATIDKLVRGAAPGP